MDLNLFETEVLVTAHDTMPYRLLRPQHQEPGKKYPLVIFLHGSGERGTDNKKQLRYMAPVFLDSSNRAGYNCFVLAPQCKPGVYWGGVSRPLIELMNQTIDSNEVDTDRIYVIGLSMGGYGVWWLMSKFPNKFAAAIPICGGGDTKWAARIKTIPTWAFHGAKDLTVKPEQSRRMVAAIKQAGGSPLYTEYATVGHNSWVSAFREPDLLPWLFSKKLQ
ncbi:MAG: prolyl oligopeptidase family serine peptidase [Bacteroidia bacterium]|nr:prolyl oligopeptidase family serine peptidase [Bacteroidia bacterium]